MTKAMLATLCVCVLSTISACGTGDDPSEPVGGDLVSFRHLGNEPIFQQVEEPPPSWSSIGFSQWNCGHHIEWIYADRAEPVLEYGQGSNVLVPQPDGSLKLLTVGNPECALLYAASGDTASLAEPGTCPMAAGKRQLSLVYQAGTVTLTSDTEAVGEHVGRFSGYESQHDEAGITWIPVNGSFTVTSSCVGK